MSINTTLNSKAVNFSCEAAGYQELWFLVDSMQSNREEIRNRGFQDIIIKISDGALRGVLTAKAYDVNNNTNVTCVARYSIGSLLSDTVFLMIQGKTTGS